MDEFSGLIAEKLEEEKEKESEQALKAVQLTRPEMTIPSRTEYEMKGKDLLKNPGDVLVSGMARPDEVLRCARMLVNAMAIPPEYWKRWTQSMYMMATTFDIMQQLVHGGKPMVKAISSISDVDIKKLSKPDCLLLDSKWYSDERPTELLRCAKAGEMQIGADGKSMFIKTESGKWLAVANPDGKRVEISDTAQAARKDKAWENLYTTYQYETQLADVAGKAKPPASEMFGLGRQRTGLSLVS